MGCNSPTFRKKATMTKPAPSLSAQIDALGIAFIELSKMLGKGDYLAITQLANAIESAAKVAKVGPEGEAASAELARKLR